MTAPLTVSEVAALTGASTRTIREACQRGTLRAEKRGRDWLIAPAVARRWKRRSVGRPKSRP